MFVPFSGTVHKRQHTFHFCEMVSRGKFSNLVVKRDEQLIWDLSEDDKYRQKEHPWLKYAVDESENEPTSYLHETPLSVREQRHKSWKWEFPTRKTQTTRKKPRENRELTYPTLGIGKSSSKVPSKEDMVVSRRVLVGLNEDGANLSHIILNDFPWLFFWNKRRRFTISTLLSTESPNGKTPQRGQRDLARSHAQSKLWRRHGDHKTPVSCGVFLTHFLWVELCTVNPPGNDSHIPDTPLRFF